MKEELRQIVEGETSIREVMEGLASKLGIELPSEKLYEEFDEMLLDNIYEGLGPDDIRGKIEKCCQYLKRDVPEFESGEQMRAFHPLIEFEYISQACYDWHVENM